ncbi:MAG: hypothetical protein KJ904_14525 [Alphaproteobacteria bacterium]|nr:hypothetical protein [Alphaproteobacteria bacterium]
MNRIGIASGFGEAYLIDLARQLVDRGVTLVVPAAPEVERRHSLPVVVWQETGAPAPFPVLQSLSGPAPAFRGTPDIGVASFGRSDIPAETLLRAREMPLVLAACAWTARLLREAGVLAVLRHPIGVDTSIFRPKPRIGLAPGRFLIFCGGPLAHHTGPDIALAAFRRFHAVHPEALLVPGWTAPGSGDWAGADALAGQSIPPEAIFDLTGRDLPGVLRECDLAVLPDRCSARVNPLALAAMASGVPVALSANTGHLDLLGDHLYALKQQADLAAQAGDPGLAGWGESSVEEVLETMQRVYDRRPEAASKARSALALITSTWSLSRQSETLVAALGKAAAGQPVALAPDAEAYAWGLCLHRADRFAEAEQVYGEVLAQKPGHIGAYMDRGHVRRLADDLEGAEADFRRALALRPGDARILRSLGHLQRRRGNLDGAAASLRESVRIDGKPGTQWDLAFTLLQMGRYAEAWAPFEHRHAALGLRRIGPATPRWKGEAVTGRTLLILDEQGLGDTLQFLRFLPLIPIGPGGRILFAGKASALPAARRLLPPEDVVDWDAPLPAFQAWDGLMSLPARLGISRPENVPPPPQALPDPARVPLWRAQVRGTDDRPVVGLCWRGNPYFSGDRERSPGLAALQPILAVEGIRFVSLQVGRGREELSTVEGGDHIADIGGAIEEAGSDVLDGIAVAANCDLVISSCTSVVHMAGSAGTPGWVLLGNPSDWRWMTGRDDTPWYPSLTLFRRFSRDWTGLAGDVALTLAHWRDSRRK